MMMKLYRHYLIYNYYFNCSLFWNEHKLTNNEKVIWVLRETSTLDPFKDFHFNFPLSPSLENGSSWLIKDYHDEEFCKVV